MKTKIAITIIGTVAFIISSFQTFESKKNYNSIVKDTNNFSLEHHQPYASKAMVSCAKCHDCQKDTTNIQDSIKIQTYSKSLKPRTAEVLKLEIKISNRKVLDWANDENPNNSKLK